MKQFLEIKNVSKTYSSRKNKTAKALDDVSLNIGRGEFVTILGPSGCGKTTILRLIAGFEKQDAGSILLEGRDIGSLAPYDRGMPMVFQNYALFPHLSIYENIAYGLKARRVPAEVIRNDVAMAAQVVNLVGLEDRFPGELSGGQKQRVALARALVLKPPIILFDEPLSNLDVKLRMQTRTEIKRVQQMLGITVLYVTHDQSEALSMSDRIVIMNKGRIVQEGSPEMVYGAPESSFVADFIGNANFIDAVVEETEGRRITVRLQNRNIVIESDDEREVFYEGEEVSLSIKPEAVAVSPETTDFSGSVDMVSFLGPVTEYRLEFEGSFINVLQSNSGNFPFRYSPGEQVNIRFNREMFRIYKK